MAGEEWRAGGRETPVELGCSRSRMILSGSYTVQKGIAIYTLLWTPWGPGEVSCIVRCPLSILGTQKSVLNTEAIQRCPNFRDVF